MSDVFGDPCNLDLWVKNLKKVSPESNVIVMDFFQPYAA